MGFGDLPEAPPGPSGGWGPGPRDRSGVGFTSTPRGGALSPAGRLLLGSGVRRAPLPGSRGHPRAVQAPPTGRRVRGGAPAGSALSDKVETLDKPIVYYLSCFWLMFSEDKSPFPFNKQVRDSRTPVGGAPLRSPRGRPPRTLFGLLPAPGRRWRPRTLREGPQGPAARG